MAAALSPSVRRWTEASNPLSLDLDVSETDTHLVRTLGAVDAGLFSASGGGLPTLPDAEVASAVARAAALAAAALAHPRGRVALCGCGTSGRLSHLESRALNRLAAALGLRADCFTHLLAGGDAALLVSQEAAEDMPGAGRDALAALLAATSDADVDGSAAAPVVAVGISCGLSATFVGSLLEHALSQPAAARVSCIALGFNPAEAVRGLRVEGWGSSFFDVLADMARPENAERAVLVNPVVGPEAVAGSSRMKGGSATKIVVEAVGMLAVAVASGRLLGEADVLASAARDIFAEFEHAVRAVYCEAPAIAAVVSAAAVALAAPTNQTQGGGAGAGAGAADSAAVGRDGGAFMSTTGFGRILYLGVGTAGLLGLIDASECPPTYGSLFNDARCFLGGGAEELGVTDGGVRTSNGARLLVPTHLRGDAALPSASRPEPIEIGVREGFLAPGVVETLSPADLVIVIAIHGDGTGFEDRGAGDVGGASPQLEAVLEGAAAAVRAGCVVRRVLVGARGTRAAAALAGAAETAAMPSRGFLALEAAVGAVAPAGVRVLLANGGATDAALGLADGTCRSFASQLATKLVLNAITTGAHVRKGTIVRNRMVNVSITNAKLFHRAVGIVAEVAQCGAAVAQRSVVRAIYRTDEGPAAASAVSGGDSSGSGAQATPLALAALEARSVLEHVSAAATQRGLVPIAILLAQASVRCGGAGGITVGQAEAALRKEPVIRRALIAAAAEKQ
jgi:N-acetylmuramic acid 6-phosphate (MurNAc-6-P) etherase